MKKREKNLLVALCFGMYSLIGLSGNAFGETIQKREYPSSQNLATDYRPLFKSNFFPCLYPPKTEEGKLDKMFLEQNAKELMKFKDLENPSVVTTYPVLEIKFRVPFLE